MKWIKNLGFFPKHVKPRLSSSKNEYQNSISNAKEIVNDILCLSPTLLQQSSSGTGSISLSGRLSLVKDEFCRFGLHSSCKGNPLRINQIPLTAFRRFGCAQNDPSISRDWLVKLWDSDEKLRNSRRKKRQRVLQNGGSSGGLFENHPSFQRQLGRWFSGASVPKQRPYEEVKPFLRQPPPSQSATGFLKPTSPEEVKVVPLLARSNLLITRNIEWANLVFGFEQENRYAIVDACYPQMPVGFISEQSNLIARQVLRLRRPFIAYITDGMGSELFRVRRPFWLINSTIFVEIDGKEIGVVHRRWHLWRRVYDLYLGDKQFAVVENPGFWNWTFTLKDIDGNVIAEIDRDWRGFGFELFTDAGQYVIRFGDVDPSSKTGPARAIKDLEVIRPLTLSERAVTLALAVSLDNDYFSRHGGWGIPFVVVGE